MKAVELTKDEIETMITALTAYSERKTTEHTAFMRTGYYQYPGKAQAGEAMAAELKQVNELLEKLRAESIREDDLPVTGNDGWQ